MQWVVCQRSGWPVLICMLDAIDEPEARKSGDLVFHEPRGHIRACTRMSFPVIKKAIAELLAIGVLVRLTPNCNQPAIYRIEHQFVPPAKFLRHYGRDEPLAPPLERDDERGRAKGTRELRTELGRR
jgi:hypothetical protein